MKQHGALAARRTVFFFYKSRKELVPYSYGFSDKVVIILLYN